MKTLPALFFALVLLAAARLDAAVTLTLTPSVQNSAHGPELVFGGTLTNTSATDKVFLNDVQASLASNVAAVLTLNGNTFFANVPGILLPGETYTGVFFSVILSAAASPGDYAGTIVVKGGADIFASGDLASAGFDGTKSLLEYALNLAPRVSNPGLPLRPDKIGGYLTISYVPNLAATGLLYAVEASVDLVHWSTANVQTVADPNPIPSNRVTVRYAPASPVTRAFVRLNVTQNGSP